MAPEDTPAQTQEDQQNTTEDTQPDSRTASDQSEEPDWKAMARKWEREAKRNSNALSKVNSEVESLREAQKTESEKALDAARREGYSKAESEWKVKWRKERVTTEAIRAMSGRVSDPRLALPHLRLPDDAVDDNGEVNRDALAQAVDDLLAEYPALAINGTSTARHHADIGPKRNPRKEVDANDLLRIALRGR